MASKNGFYADWWSITQTILSTIVDSNVVCDQSLTE